MALELQKKINMSLPAQMTTGSRSYIIEIVLLVIVSILFYWFIVTPKNADLAAKKTVLEAYKKEQSTISGNLDILNKLAAQLKSNSAEIAKLDEAIPLDGKNTNLQLLIQELAQSAGVTVSDINISNRVGVVAGDTKLLQDPYGATRTLQKFTGTAFVVGSFLQLENFLKKMESSGRLIQISSVEMQAGSDGGINLNITFNAYYLAP